MMVYMFVLKVPSTARRGRAGLHSRYGLLSPSHVRKSGGIGTRLRPGDVYGVWVPILQGLQTDLAWTWSLSLPLHGTYNILIQSCCVMYSKRLISETDICETHLWDNIANTPSLK